MPLTDRKYKTNQAILKDYGGRFYKLTCFRVLRTSGIEDDIQRRPSGTVNDEKTTVPGTRFAPLAVAPEVDLFSILA